MYTTGCHDKRYVKEAGNLNAISHSENKNVMQLTLSESEVQAAVQ